MRLIASAALRPLAFLVVPVLSVPILVAGLSGGAMAATIGSGATVSASTLGSGTAAFQGGTLAVDQSNTYTNNFTLSQTLGATNLNTIDAHGNAGTFSGVFSDAVSGVSGDITVLDSVGGGQVIFSGANAYTGPTTINFNATLALSGTGTISLSKSVQANGTFDISGTTSGAVINSLGGSGNVVLGAQSLTISLGADTFSGNISGSGGLIINGGVEVLDGTNTYTGGTTIGTGGVLEIGNEDSNGSFLGNISGGGTLEFNRTDAVVFAQILSGTSNFMLGGGTVTITVPQSYTGTTTINAGTLALSGSGNIASSQSLAVTGTFDISATSGTSIKSLTGGGTVVLGTQTLTVSAASGIFSGVISGFGSLAMTGGTEILTGTNTYTGGTSISAGTLQLGNGSTTGFIPGNISDAGTIGFNYSNAQSFTGVISGAGQVKLNGGTLTIAAPQNYTGLTTISGGTLTLSGGGTVASSQGIVDNSQFDISATAGAAIQSLSGSGLVQLGTQTLSLTNAQGTFSGSIVGTGAIVVTGGVQTFAGVNSYTGITTITAAALALTNINALALSQVIDNGTLDISGAANPSSNVAIVSIPSLAGSGAVLLGTHTLSLTSAADVFSGVISGSGGLTVASGTETLTGSNSYTGNTTISSGTLILSGNGALSAATIVADNGMFDISGVNGASAAIGSLSGSGTAALGAKNLAVTDGANDFAGIISGTGGLMVSGGTQILSGVNTYGGGTTITNGTLQLGDGAKSGSVPGNIADDGTLAFNYSGAGVFGGTISGSGGILQAGAGTTVLTGTNTYSGGTTISSGTLQIGNGGTAGSIAGDVVDNGTSVFDRSDPVTFAGSISGTGGITQMGPGTLLLTGVNSYEGTTTIASGSVLAIGPAGTIAGSSHVVDNGTLDISATPGATISSLSGAGSVSLGSQILTLASASDDYSGAILGSGGLALTGGMQTISGLSSYTGATTIANGTLNVTGSIASSSGVTVNPGGTLAGAGTVPQIVVNGTLAPGVNGSGTLNVAGSASFAGSSDFLINESSAASPKLAVSGAASLGGVISVASTDGTYLLGQKITVLTAAGGVSGSFSASAVPTAGGAQYVSTVSTDANDVFLEIDLSRLSPALPGATPRNQVNAVGGIDAALAQGDSLPAAFENLGNLTSASLTNAAKQLSGELGADLAQTGDAAFDPYRDAVFSHLAGARQAGVRPALLQNKLGVWTAITGSSNVVAGDPGAGSAKLSSSAIGFVAGVDWPVANNVLLGGALSLGSIHFRADAGLGQGKANAYQAGIYGLVQYTPRIYGAFLGAIGQETIATRRTVTVAGSDELDASLTGQHFAARYETGIDLRWIAPYVAIEDQLFNKPGYSETASSGDFALGYGADTMNKIDAEIGLRNSADLPINRNWRLQFSDRVAWRHDVAGSYDALAGYSELPNSQFTVFGAQPGKDTGVFSFSADLKSRYGLALGLELGSAISHTSQSYTEIGHLAFSW